MVLYEKAKKSLDCASRNDILIVEANLQGAIEHTSLGRKIKAEYPLVYKEFKEYIEQRKLNVGDLLTLEHPSKTFCFAITSVSRKPDQLELTTLLSAGYEIIDQLMIKKDVSGYHSIVSELLLSSVGGWSYLAKYLNESYPQDKWTVCVNNK